MDSPAIQLIHEALIALAPEGQSAALRRRSDLFRGHIEHLQNVCIGLIYAFLHVIQRRVRKQTAFTELGGHFPA